MTDIADLIQFENENTNLDFKAIQYKKDQFESFLKDILSFANAISREDKYIIIGVKHKSNGDRELLGIQEDFIDDATYQQLVDSNIEPHINFKYFPFEYNSKKYGVFKIFDCEHPPYMMKKKYGSLYLGDSFIRKGSFQNRLSRKDLDNLLQLKQNKDISDKISVSFEIDKIIKSNRIAPVEYEIPSTVKKREIQEIIDIKEKSPSPLNDITFYHALNPFSYVPYEKRSLSDLRKNLENVENDFRENDLKCIFETNAHKVNFYIHNDSNDFLEDVSVEIIAKQSSNFYISDRIYSISPSYNPYKPFVPKTATYDEINYPNVEIIEDIYKITSEIEKVKHRLPSQALKVPIRIAISPNADNFCIQFNVRLFAKNIANPIYDTLEITIE